MIKDGNKISRKACIIILIAMLASGVGMACNASAGTYPIPPSTYTLFAIQPELVGENSTCKEKNKPNTKCPPYVIYYNENQRETIRLTIKRDGLLYDSTGKLFDTRGADLSNYLYKDEQEGKVKLASAATFVMDRDGTIYASRAHKTFLFQHSTMLAGAPVAAAGEMIVFEGKVHHVNPCSGHYQPDWEKAGKQLGLSLKRQGYSELKLRGLTFYTHIICTNEENYNKAKTEKEREKLLNAQKREERHLFK